MIRNFKFALLAVAGVSAVASLPELQAAEPSRPAGEPSWSYGVVRVGEEREAIKSKPITERPYRPFHFYGNTVRRMHYRGTAVPAPRDIVGASAATIMRK
jgi:hypothetical protein